MSPLHLPSSLSRNRSDTYPYTISSPRNTSTSPSFLSLPRTAPSPPSPYGFHPQASTSLSYPRYFEQPTLPVPNSQSVTTSIHTNNNNNINNNYTTSSPTNRIAEALLRLVETRSGLEHKVYKTSQGIANLSHRMASNHARLESSVAYHAYHHNLLNCSSKKMCDRANEILKKGKEMRSKTQEHFEEMKYLRHRWGELRIESEERRGRWEIEDGEKKEREMGMRVYPTGSDGADDEDYFNRDARVGLRSSTRTIGTTISPDYRASRDLCSVNYFAPPDHNTTTRRRPDSDAQSYTPGLEDSITVDTHWHSRTTPFSSPLRNVIVPFNSDDVMHDNYTGQERRPSPTSSLEQSMRNEEDDERLFRYNNAHPELYDAVPSGFNNEELFGEDTYSVGEEAFVNEDLEEEEEKGNSSGSSDSYTWDIPRTDTPVELQRGSFPQPVEFTTRVDRTDYDNFGGASHDEVRNGIGITPTITITTHTTSHPTDTIPPHRTTHRDIPLGNGKRYRLSRLESEYDSIIDPLGLSEHRTTKKEYNAEDFEAAYIASQAKLHKKEVMEGRGEVVDPRPFKQLARDIYTHTRKPSSLFDPGRLVEMSEKQPAGGEGFVEEGKIGGKKGMGGSRLFNLEGLDDNTGEGDGLDAVVEEEYFEGLKRKAGIETEPPIEFGRIPVQKPIQKPYKEYHGAKKIQDCVKLTPDLSDSPTIRPTNYLSSSSEEEEEQLSNVPYNAGRDTDDLSLYAIVYDNGSRSCTPRPTNNNTTTTPTANNTPRSNMNNNGGISNDMTITQIEADNVTATTRTNTATPSSVRTYASTHTPTSSRGSVRIMKLSVPLSPPPKSKAPPSTGERLRRQFNRLPKIRSFKDLLSKATAVKNTGFTKGHKRTESKMETLTMVALTPRNEKKLAEAVKYRGGLSNFARYITQRAERFHPSNNPLSSSSRYSVISPGGRRGSTVGDGGEAKACLNCIMKGKTCSVRQGEEGRACLTCRDEKQCMDFYRAENGGIGGSGSGSGEYVAVARRGCFPEGLEERFWWWRE